LVLFYSIRFYVRGGDMNYNWDGDIIIQDSAVDKKRYVIGSKRPITTDIREFVSPADDVVIKGILAKLTETKKMPSSKNPGDFDRRALLIWDHVARNVRYKFDAKEQRKDDFWLFPSEVHTLAYGDCEDGSFLLASLLIGSGISPFNVRVALGELYDGKGTPLGGHCWPMYKNEAGRWCILESTFDRAPRSLPTADRFTDSGDSRYLPHFCFNNYHLWAIRHEMKPERNIQNYLKKKSKRGALANMNNTEFPSGGFLSIITGDASPGHLELTSDALEKFGFSEDAIAMASDAAQDDEKIQRRFCSFWSQGCQGREVQVPRQSGLGSLHGGIPGVQGSGKEVPAGTVCQSGRTLEETGHFRETAGSNLTLTEKGGAHGHCEATEEMDRHGLSGR
jgi:hypothetical protein